MAAVVAYYPPVDLRPLARGIDPEIGNDRFPALNFDPSEAWSVSPIVHASGDDPPTLLIHGDADGLVPVSNSHDLHAALQEQGGESKAIILPGAGHGFRGADAELAMTALVDWFAQHLAH